MGFTETLIPKEKVTPITSINPNSCQNIYLNGFQINKKYSVPSEFPKLTKIKPITVKKGGNKKSKRRKTRKAV